MELTSANVNNWQIKVKYQENGALKATASGVLLVPPQDALVFVTDAAGDKLFRVTERNALPDGAQGSKRVEVVNKAAIRVLAWKLWSTSTVIYEIEPKSGKEAGSTVHLEALLPFTAGPVVEQKEEHVSFELVSSSMLQSLTGRWKLQPVRLHYTELPQDLLLPNPAAGQAAGYNVSSKATPASVQCSSPRKPALGLLGSMLSPRNTSSSTANRSPGLVHKIAALSPRRKPTAGASPNTRPVVEITAVTSSSSIDGSAIAGGVGSGLGGLFGAGSLVGGLWGSSSSNGSKDFSKASVQEPCLPPGLTPDADGFVTATLVQYEQLAQPKGMPPGIRYVPGLSDAVAASVGKEVRQMLEKVACVSDAAVTRVLKPQEALSFVIEQMEVAGGSFKALQKQLRKQQQQQLKHTALAATASGIMHVRDECNLLLPVEATTTMASALNPVQQPLNASELGTRAAAANKLISHPVLLTDPEYVD